MEQLPKIARARMAAQVVGAHPEAELLNAFAENALGPKERESVLTHLAACGSCREIVSLAAEAPPEGAPVMKPARAGFRWATFQWAAVAASLAIVTVAVLIVGPKQTRRTGSGPIALKQEPAAAPSAAASSSSDVVAENRVSTPKPNASEKGRSQEAKSKVVNGVGAGSSAGGAVGGIVGGMRQTDHDQKAATTDALAKLPEKKEAPAESAAKAPPGNYAYSTSAQVNDTFAAVRTAPSANLPTQGAASANKQIAQTPAAPATTVESERGRAEEQDRNSNETKKDAAGNFSVAANTESVQPSAKARSLTSLYKMETKSAGSIVTTRLDSGAVRLWRLYAGKVQSSDDGGKVWQEKSPDSSGLLTKVAALGQQIFLGGKAGAFFVSRDNGKSWEKVSLTGDVIIPLGDVTDIKTKKPQTLDVILNTGDDWQSNDGGNSFRLLPKP